MSISSVVAFCLSAGTPCFLSHQLDSCILFQLLLLGGLLVFTSPLASRLLMLRTCKFILSTLHTTSQAHDLNRGLRGQKDLESHHPFPLQTDITTPTSQVWLPESGPDGAAEGGLAFCLGVASGICHPAPSKIAGRVSPYWNN